MNLRFLAAEILLKVTQEHYSLTECLSDVTVKDPRDKALLQSMCFGVCRFYFRLDAIAKKLLEKPLKEKDQDIYLLILIGLYQLIEMRLPDYAAVSETVDAAVKFKKLWGKNLINAVLRNFQRKKEQILASIEKDPVAVYSHPRWMINKIKSDWPNDWQEILIANNQHPPLSLRVNQIKISREDYLKKLAAEDIVAFAIPETESGINLEVPRDVDSIPGFFQGEVSVQDGAAQLAAELLQLKPKQRVLDACAAPGGKTLHILEKTNNDVSLLAIDEVEDRLKSVEQNLNRLGLTTECICADAGDTASWWDGKHFDRILLDAPCTASGVIRRHPDIKLLREPSDIAQAVAEQYRLLTALWPLLAPGGLMVYGTCSVFPEENSQVIQAFLESHKDAKEEKSQQILPGMHGMDGFYYACLRK